jgi:superfamily II DNA/RNA helicase
MHNIGVHILVAQILAPVQNRRFGNLPMGDGIANALDALGFVDPTPIQEQAIPLLRSGRDVIGLAKTGSGKTAGFGIPLIESIKTSERRVQALILTPTRELASQVAAALSALGRSSGVRVVAVYGGVGMQAQIDALRGNAHVVVGTPGRVLDHISRGTLDLRQARFVVLDEADRMFDVGFAPAIIRILGYVPATRQTALFSATFPTAVEALAARHTVNAARVAVDVQGAALETLEERFMRVGAPSEKIDTLHDILINAECRLALVFRRTTHKADKLAQDLERRGFSVATLHGRRSQAQREKALGALRAGKLKALVATDIAARGLDITGLTHVINYDLPDTAENYTHRIGRTARMGADGIAITLVSPEDETDLLQIQRKLPASPGRLVPPAETRHSRPQGRPAPRANGWGSQSRERSSSRAATGNSQFRGRSSANGEAANSQPHAARPSGQRPDSWQHRPQAHPVQSPAPTGAEWIDPPVRDVRRAVVAPNAQPVRARA